MKTYCVSFTLTGKAWTHVSAKTEEKAIEAAWDAYNEGVEFEHEWELEGGVEDGTVESVTEGEERDGR